MRRLGAGGGIPERCSREPREVELAFWAGTPWKVQYSKKEKGTGKPQLVIIKNQWVKIKIKSKCGNNEKKTKA